MNSEYKLAELTKIVRGLALISRQLLSEARTVSPAPDDLDGVEDMIAALDERIEALRPTGGASHNNDWRGRARAVLDNVDAVRHNRARAKEV